MFNCGTSINDVVIILKRHIVSHVIVFFLKSNKQGSCYKFLPQILISNAIHIFVFLFKYSASDTFLNVYDWPLLVLSILLLKRVLHLERFAIKGGLVSGEVLITGPRCN